MVTAPQVHVSFFTCMADQNMFFLSNGMGDRAILTDWNITL